MSLSADQREAIAEAIDDENESPAAALRRIADEVRGWPSYLRTSTSVANAARQGEQPK